MNRIRNDNKSSSNVIWQLRGIPCPKCGQTIFMELTALFSEDPIKCEQCGLELRVNVSESKETLRVLKTYMDQITQLQSDLSKKTEGITQRQPSSGRHTRQVREGRRRF